MSQAANRQTAEAGQIEPADDASPQHDGNESVLEDGDSGIYDAASSNISATPSLYTYSQVNGRTYHTYRDADEKYLFPVDMDELDRVDLFYHALRLTMNETLYFAPIESPHSVLDIGTGTGIWAIDFADIHPETEVIGTDISPIQPLYIPSNLTFEIADADDEWTWRPRFDLVHCRVLNDFTVHSWPHYFEQAHKVLKPGGWVECQEMDYRGKSDDDTIPPDSQLKFWEDEWTRGIQMTGVNGYCKPDLVLQQMRDAGFVNVSKRLFKLPIGLWPKNPQLRETGRLGAANLLQGFHGISVKIFTELLRYSVEEMEVLLAACRKEVKDRRCHRYWNVYILLGQKPRATSSDDSAYESSVMSG